MNFLIYSTHYTSGCNSDSLEIGGNKLNILDVTLLNNKEKLEFDWYKMPTFS